SGLFTVPCVEGGAVETLLQNFINCNEIYGEAEVTVACKYNKRAKELSNKYKKTKFLYYSKWNENKILRLFMIILYRLAGLIGISIPKYVYSWQVFKLAKKENFDFFIIEEGDCFSFDYFAEYFGKNKMISHTHSSWPMNDKFASIYGGAFVPSEFTKKTLIDGKYNYYDKYMGIVKNCVDPTMFANVSFEQVNQLKTQYNLHSDDFVILFVGRIVKDKGVEELIKAIKGENKYKLIIVGSALLSKKTNSPYERRISELIHENENVIQVGYVPYENLKEYYALSNLVVTPSYAKDSACMVNIEAMVMGKAIISSNDAGIPEYVTNGRNAILVELDSLEENLKRSLKMLYENQSILRDMENANREDCIKFYPDVYYRDIINYLTWLKDEHR
ncbi:MAG: glycosyltransferase family 4 protein, partial [Anaerorhabdus sp.]